MILKHTIFIYHKYEDVKAYMEFLKDPYYFEAINMTTFSPKDGNGIVVFENGDTIKILKVTSHTMVKQLHHKRCHTLVATTDVLDMIYDNEDMYDDLISPMMAIHPHRGSYGYPVRFTHGISLCKIFNTEDFAIEDAFKLEEEKESETEMTPWYDLELDITRGIQYYIRNKEKEVTYNGKKRSGFL